MSNVLVEKASLQAIANAIRYKNGTQNSYKPDEMAAAILALSGGGIVPAGELDITENGTYDVTQYASADVDVEGTTPTGTLEISVNGEYDVSAYANADVDVPTGTVPTGVIEIDENGVYDVSQYASADVDVPTGVTPSGTLQINSNGTHDVTDYASAEVNVSGGSTLTTKNISTNGTYNASSDSADGYSQVTVAVPASAVDTGTKSITENGNNQDVVGYAAVNVNVPNTYTASDEGKVVDNGALVAQTAHADVTPTDSDQTIDTTLNNFIKVIGDADLVAGNIKKDVQIFGVTGTYEGGGGSASPFTLLDTITIPEDTRAISVDVSEYSDNEIIFLEADFELTQADYLYIVKNGDSPTGGSYSTSQKVFKGIICAAGHWVSVSANTKLSSISSNTTLQTTSGFPTNYYFYTYTATKLIKAGGKINIYGYNL